METQHIGDTMATENKITNEIVHKLKNRWVLWAHLPQTQEPDWTSVRSYKKICQFNNVEDAIAVTESLPEPFVKSCMLFLMKEGITPMWEDPKNRHGGYFSYKITNKNVFEVWRDLSYVIVGETVSSSSSFVNAVTGITISPKKNFCIVKIWMTNCEHQNPQIVTNEIRNLIPQGCIFGKHKPEF